MQAGMQRTRPCPRHSRCTGSASTIRIHRWSVSRESALAPHDVQDYFEWCAGRTPMVCDQIDWTRVYLEEQVRSFFLFITVLSPSNHAHLHLGQANSSQAFGTRIGRAVLDNSTRLYGSVRAANKVLCWLADSSM